MKNFKAMAKAKAILSVILSVLLMFGSAQARAMNAPEEVVKQTVDTLVSNIQKNRVTYKANNATLYDMVDKTLIPAIHVDRMAKLILGKHARKVSPQQIAAFAKEFKTFLMRSYSTVLLEYTGDEKVVYKPVERKGKDKVLVKAELVSPQGKATPVNLYMSNRRDTQWRAYNIEVAGINFVSTYRATFGEIVASKGIDGLIADLKQKNAALGS